MPPAPDPNATIVKLFEALTAELQRLAIIPATIGAAGAPGESQPPPELSENVPDPADPFVARLQQLGLPLDRREGGTGYTVEMLYRWHGRSYLLANMEKASQTLPDPSTMNKGRFLGACRENWARAESFNPPMPPATRALELVQAGMDPETAYRIAYGAGTPRDNPTGRRTKGHL